MQNEICQTAINPKNVKFMDSILNKNGVKVEVGKWYNFYNLVSCTDSERRKVTELIVDPDGVCRTVRTQGTFWFDKSVRWLSWILS